MDQGTPNRGDAVTTEIPLPARADLRSHAKRPLFLADWLDATFIHFALPPETLRPFVPFPLDVFDGEAFVSLVAFTQQRLRPARPHSLMGCKHATTNSPRLRTQQVHLSC